MPKLDLNGVSIHYELSGKPEGDALVFSSSLGAHLEMWEPQTETLDKTFRILRYDMRGHGRSSVPRGPYSIDQLGGDIVALLDALGLGRVHYCGLSIGGVLGQWLAINEPERVNKLILCNTAAKIGTTETWNDRIAAVTGTGMAALATASLDRWFTPSFRATEAPMMARMQRMLLEDDPGGYTATCAVLRDGDFRTQSATIQAPTLIIAGEHDPVTTVRDAEELQRLIPGSQLRILPAAHISNVELPEIFNAAVLEFLKR